MIRMAFRAVSASVMLSQPKNPPPVSKIAENPPPVSKTAENPPPVPKVVDWSKKGFVISVRHQYSSNYCTGHAVVGAVEGMHFKHTGELLELSDQRLIDCADCSQIGGGICFADVYNYFKKTPWLPIRENYPDHVVPPLMWVRQ